MQQPHPKTPSQTDPTQKRILEEAERLFAEKGFDGVSVREITQAAGAHLASINYHFGSKKGLYLEVFRARWIPRGEKIIAQLRRLDQKPTIRPHEVVRAVAEGFIHKSMSDEEAMRHHQLFAREMVRRSEAFDLIFSQASKPLFMLIRRLLGKALHRDPHSQKTALAALSVFAQVVFFNASRPLARMSAGLGLEDNYLDKVVDHIVDFSLHGLEGMAYGRAES